MIAVDPAIPRRPPDAIGRGKTGKQEFPVLPEFIGSAHGAESVIPREGLENSGHPGARRFSVIIGERDELAGSGILPRVEGRNQPRLDDRNVPDFESAPAGRFDRPQSWMVICACHHEDDEVGCSLSGQRIQTPPKIVRAAVAGDNYGEANTGRHNEKG